MVDCFTDGNEFLGLPPICLEGTALASNSRFVTATFTQRLQALFDSRKMLIVKFSCFLTVMAVFG
jgi:hypothetical protein